jgi:DNA (cytosine-5)-methyltransferase 1
MEDARLSRVPNRARYQPLVGQAIGLEDSVVTPTAPTVLEICAGAGGQALGLEAAGFLHVGAVDNDADACKTLLTNRPDWEVLQEDVREVRGRAYRGVDLLAGGVPCPPFSIAGKQLGSEDERDLFPEALRLASEVLPKAVLLENVRGFATPRFASYRERLFEQLENLGYAVFWRVVDAVDYGVPQYRPRFLIVALRDQYRNHFRWPAAGHHRVTVSDSVSDLMGEHGWQGLSVWQSRAAGIAPTIVGGSKKHGGPDLGPTRARAEWRKLGVDGKGIADDAPAHDFPADGLPRLTVEMVARIQGFPDSWQFVGKKTSSYKQVGNAFPPPVAKSIALSIARAIMPRPEAAPRQLPLLVR